MLFEIHTHTHMHVYEPSTGHGITNLTFAN